MLNHLDHLHCNNKLRLNTKELDTFKHGLDHRERGQAIHVALENLYAAIPHKAALASLISSRDEELDTKLDAAVAIAKKIKSQMGKAGL